MDHGRTPLLINILLNANNLQEELLEYLSCIYSFITVLNILTRGKSVQHDYEQLNLISVYDCFQVGAEEMEGFTKEVLTMWKVLVVE